MQIETLIICLSFIVLFALAYRKHKQVLQHLELTLKAVHLEHVSVMETEVQRLSLQLAQTKFDVGVQITSKLAEQEARLKQQHEKEILHAKFEAEQRVSVATKEARKDANKRSRAVIRGQATEHLAPLMHTDFNFKDFRFLGDPIDYLICAGSSAIKDGTSDAIDEIVLLDIKTGKSQLNKTQRRIRDAVVEGRVSFAIYNTDENTTRYWKREVDEDTLT